MIKNFTLDYYNKNYKVYLIYTQYISPKIDMFESKMVRSALRSKKTNTNKFVPLIKIEADKLYT